MNSNVNNKTLTIVSVTGHQDYAQGSAYAIERSYKELQKKFSVEQLKCLLVSPERPDNLADYVDHIACEPFSYLEYNLFILYSLHDLIDTDFALIVQNDGFVVDGNNWQDAFLDYDFIGAPLLRMHEITEDGQWKEYLNEECYPFYENMPEHLFEGQNGGFSLRSKKLLGIMRELNIRTVFPIPQPLNKVGKVSLKYKTLDHNEDMVITVIARHLLEEKGIRIAPPILAAYFACESADTQIRRKIPFNKIFGCHSFGHLVLVDENRLYMQKKTVFIGNNISTNVMCGWLLKAGIEITVPGKYFSTEA